MPFRWNTLPGIVAVASWCALAASPARAGVVSLEYEEAVRLYARGERQAALAALSRLRPGDLDEQVHALQRAAKKAARCPSCPDPLKDFPLKAAVMLHVDRDEEWRPVAAGTEQPRQCPADHTHRAGQIAALLAQREPQNDFSRRFFLAMAQRCQWDFCLDAAVQWGRDGLERFPRDPSLLLTVGATVEEEATLWTTGRTAPAQRTRTAATTMASLRERERLFLDAERVLAEAVETDPAMTEARIRLGRVQFWLGHDEAARKTLEEALRRGGPSPLRYLAHLFLGQVHERGGATAEAIREFTRALEVHPESQAARVALSEATLSTGDDEGARAILEQALALAGRRSARDAHWGYVASTSDGGAALFNELRQETLE
jgi:tetratricopeptide (TPR) repeat protein